MKALCHVQTSQPPESGAKLLLFTNYLVCGLVMPQEWLRGFTEKVTQMSRKLTLLNHNNHHPVLKLTQHTIAQPLNGLPWKRHFYSLTAHAYTAKRTVRTASVFSSGTKATCSRDVCHINRSCLEQIPMMVSVKLSLQILYDKRRTTGSLRVLFCAHWQKQEQTIAHKDILGTK